MSWSRVTDRTLPSPACAMHGLKRERHVVSWVVVAFVSSRERYGEFTSHKIVY